ncbi:methyltransferase domain-containing protein [Streptomyces sp. SCUT-3]|uniref:SAM-dependent methyltransferase n=1 Tax=Streptomyces sp. SCUT-3 TaxID=2684469 RepID=UPI0015F90DFB|nr:cyclopropane-fatty-acyl-phospholipid synthase family protein [Streptomyces sp. SCUT-3]QMV25155.1 methyltransferase domain-containing protein [Streptomyces sp. SCUT-3]
MAHAAGRLCRILEQALGAPPPLRIRAWDGSTAGPPDGPAVVLRDRRALRRLMWRPDRLGLARAWVAGEIDVEGDLYEALGRLTGIVLHTGKEPPRSPAARVLRALEAPARLRDPAARRALAEAVLLAGPGLPPRPPREEARARRGPLHATHRDRAAVSHHYDVGNDFYELVLGPSMVYSCAYWEGPGASLEDAQRAKLDLVCRKLGLRPGQRLLDVGCGWGSLVLHAAEHHGAEAVGITLSAEQASYARERVAAAGLADRVEIRLQDYRETADGPYDAISSIGMAEHVGSARYREYADRLYALLRPGGRLLNHQIARRPWKDESAYRTDEFIDAYVFPDGELAPLGTTVTLLEEAGFEVRDVESLREHYGLTLRRWVENLETGWLRALELVPPGRARVWRLYMAASALAFEQNRIGVNQVLAMRTGPDGASGMPPVRERWLLRPG